MSLADDIREDNVALMSSFIKAIEHINTRIRTAKDQKDLEVLSAAIDDYVSTVSDALIEYYTKKL